MISLYTCIVDIHVSVNNIILKTLPWKLSTTLSLLLCCTYRCQRCEANFGCHVSCPILSSDFNEIWISWQNFVKVPSIKFHENVSSWNRQTDMTTKAALFWIMAQQVEVIFTDVSGQPIDPILGVQETKSFGFFILSRNVGKNYRYSLRKNPEEPISHTLLGGILK